MTQPTTRDPRVGLVLGAGGVLGGAWLTGALHALTEETGWDPGSADHILGTSAGSVIGALVAAGVPPWFMVAHSAGESFDGLNGPDGRPASEADRAAGGNFKFEMRNIPWAPARCAWRSRRCPTRCGTRRPALAGWLPAGMVSTESIKDTVKRAVAGRWVEHQAFWAVACDYRTGKRVPFGRVDAPTAEIADAVAASCAIPGFFRPVHIRGRPYVDGGVCSASSVDLLAGHGLDLIICLTPLSARHRVGGLHPFDRLGDASRAANGRRLGHEIKKVRRYGTDVLTIQPSAADLG